MYVKSLEIENFRNYDHLNIEFDEKIEYTIVGSTEVNLAENRISNESPLGSALLGSKKNNVVEVGNPVCLS